MPAVLRHYGHRDSRIDRPHVGDDDAISLAVLAHVGREARRAFGVAGVQVRRQCRAPERNRLAVLERAIDLHRREARRRRVSPAKVCAAAGLQQVLVAIRDRERCARHLFQRHGRHVIEVTVRRGEDLDVAHLEAEFFDARLDVGRGLSQPCIHEDVALRSGDQVKSEDRSCRPSRYCRSA